MINVNPVFDQILKELENLSMSELVTVANEQYGLDWVTDTVDVNDIIDACISVEQHNFFG